jgi:hypothetical protein
MPLPSGQRSLRSIPKGTSPRPCHAPAAQGGVPVGTLAIGKAGAANAALLAIAILAGNWPELREKMRAWRKARAERCRRQTRLCGRPRELVQQNAALDP